MHVQTNELNLLQESSSFLILERAKVRESIDSLHTKLPPGGRIMAMVKADGYGQGALRFSKLLSEEGIDIFGVAYLAEGIALRQGGIRDDIFVMHALPNQVEQLVFWNLQVGISDEAMLQALAREAERQSTLAKIHLHINTGMTRFGVNPRDALSLAKRLWTSPHIKLEGVMTHLASSDDEEQDSFTLAQIRTFDSVLTTLQEQGIKPQWMHAANSAGLLRFGSHLNMARVGISLINKATTFVSKIVHIHECMQGDTVGYHRRYQVKKDHERIGVISCGYHDGIPCSISGKGYADILGKKAPYVGKVCMDYMMVDLTNIREANLFDEVLLFGTYKGSHISLDLFAEWAGTISHEILCKIASRVHKIYL
mgnify:CR=1 FL=1